MNFYTRIGVYYGDSSNAWFRNAKREAIVLV